MITGGPGSGKSTLARSLGDTTGLPVFHMDKIHHLDDWQPRPMAEKHKMAHEIEGKPQWIFEGGMSSTYASRATRADTLIFLDLPVGLRFYRVVKRLLQNYGQTRPDMAPNCVEKFHGETFAFWKWIWDTRHTHRVQLLTLIDDYPHLRVHHLKTRQAVNDFWTAFPKTGDTP